jgi:hypothetical protein
MNGKSSILIFIVVSFVFVLINWLIIDNESNSKYRYNRQDYIVGVTFNRKIENAPSFSVSYDNSLPSILSSGTMITNSISNYTSLNSSNSKGLSSNKWSKKGSSLYKIIRFNTETYNSSPSTVNSVMVGAEYNNSLSNTQSSQISNSSFSDFIQIPTMFDSGFGFNKPKKTTTNQFNFGNPSTMMNERNDLYNNSIFGSR